MRLQSMSLILLEKTISFDNCIHVMTDNPNVMRGQFKGVVTQLKVEHASHLVDIGGCSLHHVSNAVKNCLPELYLCNELEDFLQDVSAFFSFHVEFSEIFSHIQDIFNLEKHQILRYCEVRFLSIYPVVVRIIEQYKAIKKLFLDTKPKNHKKVAKQARIIRKIKALKNRFITNIAFHT